MGWERFGAAQTWCKHVIPFCRQHLQTMDLQWNNALCGNTSLRHSDSHHRRYQLHPRREPKQSHKGSRGTKQQPRELSQQQSLQCAHVQGVKEEQQRKKLGLNEPRHSCRDPKSRAACSLCHHHVYQLLQLLLGGIQTPPFVTGHQSASTVQLVRNKLFELFYCTDKDKWKKCRSNQ